MGSYFLTGGEKKMTIYLLWSVWRENGKMELLGVFNLQSRAEEEGSRHWTYEKRLYIEERKLNKKEAAYLSDSKYIKQHIDGYWENYKRSEIPF